MYDFGGIVYRILGVCGPTLFLGILCMLIDTRWKRAGSIRECKIGIVAIALAICMGFLYTSRIVFPDVSCYTGAFIEMHRNSRVAPPLPFTYEYVFWNETGNKQVFYLDVFSKNDMFPYDFDNNKEYKIYYDEFTNVIVKVDFV